ncbi:MAG: recombinase family protein, partial [Treponema sp.]|nr:recombinase family protein [Treponema sp.]
QEAGINERNLFLDKQSGKDFERKNYQKLLTVLDETSVLFVTSLDRLGRNYKDIIQQWKIITQEKGSDIVVLDMPLLDTRNKKDLLGTLISDLVLTILSYVAETERNFIRNRQAEGIAAAQRRGVVFGRPKITLPESFIESEKLYKSGKISLTEAAKLCGMCRSTFWAKVTKY